MSVRPGILGISWVILLVHRDLSIHLLGVLSYRQFIGQDEVHHRAVFVLLAPIRVHFFLSVLAADNPKNLWQGDTVGDCELVFGSC